MSLKFPSLFSRPNLYFWILIFLSALSSASAYPVDIAHPVYAFIHRLEMEGKVGKNFSGTLPWSNADIQMALHDAEENDKIVDLGKRATGNLCK
jgi:uncharacterized lipoprotein YbaY